MAEPHKSVWIADCTKIRQALHDIESATQRCTKEDMESLHMAGYLPSGVFNYLMACRVKINGN